MVTCLVAFVGSLAVAAAGPAPRYNVAADTAAFPQQTPQETLASVLKAVDAKRFDYVVAQLASPAWVDERVRRLYGGRFDAQVEDTRVRLDAPTVKQLRRFAKDGSWITDKNTATVTLKDVEDRAIHFRLMDGRWYLENQIKP